MRASPWRTVAMLLVAAATTSSPAVAQMEFPSRRINVVVPYPAGGVVDVVTRIVTEKLAAIWGQPIIVENKPGAGGNIGTDFAARAAPDGYTWTFMGPPVMANPRIYSNLRWSEKSFKGVAVIAWAPGAMVVHPSFPANTVSEFVERARKAPGVFNYGNAGTGSSVHLNTTLFMREANIELTSVPYSGQPPAIIDLLANRIDVKFASIGLVAQHVQSGALKALAVVGNRRSPLLPDVPTMAEAGYPSANLLPWYGFAVPKDVPQPIVEKIVATVAQVVTDPAVQKQLEQQALEAVKPMTAQEITDLIAKDAERYAALIREAGIKLGD